MGDNFHIVGISLGQLSIMGMKVTTYPWQYPHKHAMLPKKLSPGKVFFLKEMGVSTHINQPWLYGLNQHQPTINQPFLYGVLFTRDSQQSRKKTLLGIPHKYHWLGSMGNGCDWTLAGGYRTTKMMASFREGLFDIHHDGKFMIFIIWDIQYDDVSHQILYGKKAPHVQTQSGF